MSRQDGLCVWTETVSTHLPHLSKPQATGLALGSYGITEAPCGWSGPVPPTNAQPT
jgi:hypothetical protein